MPVKNNKEAYEKIMSINKNNDYTTSNLLNYEYFSKHYKLIAIDLNKQIELENLDLRQCFSLLRNQKKQHLNFYKIMWVSNKMETQKNHKLVKWFKQWRVKILLQKSGTS